MKKIPTFLIIKWNLPFRAGGSVFIHDQDPVVGAVVTVLTDHAGQTLTLSGDLHMTNT